MATESEMSDPGLRAQNRRDRREALVSAAYGLFAERGFGATTMDDIASAAGLSRRTAFRYFQTKEALVFPDREERLEALAELLVAREGESSFETVKRASLALARRYQDERVEMLRQFELVSREPSLLGREQVLDRAFEELIEAAFVRASEGERETTRTRRRARVRAAAVVGAIRATLREWLEGGASGDLARLGRETFAELESGFGDEQ